ncbi:hypothetical protein HPP92_005773 [Vanilla planifolia]|uniref:C2H2-type domain-containing protein n=1 Tax=Vanilla planifolia TaxID=51239 RepID=A0A835RNB8_VANPL|nr:hypothetical protein HPP92_005773 [Vanilla planifolia]
MEKDKLMGKFGSWSSLCLELSCRDEEERGMGEDTQESAIALVGKKRRRRRTRKIGSIFTSDSPQEYEKEEEDGALSLMMLSRDAGSVSASSDKSSVIMDEEGRFESTVSRFELKKDVSFGSDDDDDKEFRKQHHTFDSKGKDYCKRSRYECSSCNKSFHTYQALGGHRASYRKNKGCYVSESPATREVMTKKVRTHICPVCEKVFPSGQALGGHKRSHLARAGDNWSSAALAALVEIGDDASEPNGPYVNLACF